ncbi:MAG: DUF2490 domain-containing protein [Saprospiraceae bacterium]
MLPIMKHLPIILLCLISFLSSAQKQITSQPQIWFKYYLKIPINPQWQIRQEIDDRNFINPARQSQFLERTHLQRNLGKGWITSLGFTYSEVATPADPNITTYGNNRELRPSLEIGHLNKLNEKWNLHQRVWNEFRFFQQNDKSYLYSNMRLRYKIETHFKLSSLLSFFAFEELHINLGKNIVFNTFDQNRFGIGCEISPIKNIGFEFTYINWFQQRSSGNEYFNRNIFRLALNHTLMLRKRNPVEN